LVVLANLAARPSGKNLAFYGYALIKKLNGVNACHATNMVAHADPPALVGASDRLSVDNIMEYRSGTR
jgi:hypothetical protein